MTFALGIKTPIHLNGKIGVLLTTVLFSDIFESMLEFSSFCDAHFHLIQSTEYETPFADFDDETDYCACTCAHDVAEFYAQEKLLAELKRRKNIRLVPSFGLHPQNPLIENADFLETLLKENRIGAIGEAGFDLFTKEFKADFDRQKEAWRIQLELASAYQKPLVIHCRKAIDYVFADIKALKKAPAVLFHSFFGGIIEARALLAKGLNAYFSFGKQILNGNKKTIFCVRALPTKNLLLETDAPFQTLKSEPFTPLTDIRRAYSAAYALREDSGMPDDFAAAMKDNFTALYGGWNNWE
ncbi:MAG: TatD family hydrolase [Treponema sp.]